jgi:hypothetical protein
MKPLVQLTLIAVFVSVAHFAAAAEPVDRPAMHIDSGDRPLGVDADAWISVSDKLGFVIVRSVQPLPDKAKYLMRGPCATDLRARKSVPCDNTVLLSHVAPPPAPAEGYFMVKSSEGWRRLVVMTLADILSAKN